MTKQELIYYIKEFWDGNEKKDIHPDTVKFAISKAWNQILYDAFRKNHQHLAFYAKEYTGQTAVLDATVNKYEMALPAPILQLPDMDLKEGVRSITVDEYEDLDFVPISEYQLKMYYNLDVYNVDTTIGYMVYYDRLVFDDNMTAAIAAANIRLLLVIPFDEYSDSEEVPVPSGKDSDLQNLAISFLKEVAQDIGTYST
jgi:hypothetical protein